MHGMKIKIVESLRYLGLIIDQKLNFEKHLQLMDEKIKKTLYGFKRIGMTQYDIDNWDLLILYKGGLRPIMTYGCAIWGEKILKQKFEKKLRQIERKCLLQLIGCYNTVPTESLNILAGIMPIDLYVSKLRARHILKEAGEMILNEKKIIGNNKVNRQKITQELIKGWQIRWDKAKVGRTTYSYIPDVQTVKRKKWFRPGKGILEFITHHGNFRTYLQRIGREKNIECECGKGKDTPDHLMWDCDLYGIERKAFIKQYMKLDVINTKKKLPLLEKKQNLTFLENTSIK